MKKIFLTFVLLIAASFCFAEKFKPGTILITDKFENGTYFEVEILTENTLMFKINVQFFGDYVSIPTKLNYDEKKMYSDDGNEENTFFYTYKDKICILEEYPDNPLKIKE